MALLRSLPVKAPKQLVLSGHYFPPNPPHCADKVCNDVPPFSLLSFNRMREHDETLAGIFGFTAALAVLVPARPTAWVDTMVALRAV